MINFIKSAPGAYDAVIRNGWIDSLRNLYDQKANWKNIESCRMAAINYSTITAFEKACSGAYRSANNNGWLWDITQHMKRPYKGKG